MTPTEPPGRAPSSGAEGLAEPLRSRWSPSVFDPGHDLADADLEMLLQAARWAPSYGNLQPWAFVVARRGAPAHEVLRAHLRPGNAAWVPRAAVVLLAAARVEEGPDGEGVKEAAYSHYDLGQAAAHLTLQARAMGLHAHQFGGFDREAVAERLGVPDWYQLMTGIAVGALGDPAIASERDRERHLHRPRTRRPLADVVHVDRWGRPWPPAGDPS